MATTIIKDGAWTASINPGETATFSTAQKYVDKNISVRAIPQTIGNGTVTITQNGTNKGSFTLNQSGNVTIALTDNNTTYGVATSSSLGLVKSGTDITVDSSGNVSVNDNSHTHTPDQITDGYTSNAFYINTHPENNSTIIPFINNDIAFLTKRGGSAVVKYDGVTQSVNISNVFDGSGSYWSINPTGITTITIELTLHRVFTWTNTVYIDCGANTWRAKNMKIEVMNTNYSNDTWSTKGNVTNYGRSQYKITFNHTPSGASNGGGGFNKIKFTFSGWNFSTSFRIACLGIINYGSSGIREVCVPKDGGIMYGGITPYVNNSYNIGSSDKKYANIYSTNFIGNATSATKATQDGNGNIISSTYLPLSGGEMTGNIRWNKDSLPQFNDNPQYLLGIEAFANGGAMKWQHIDSITVGAATKATQDESGNNIKSSYASSISISDHTITLKNKNGASLGIVAVPDTNTWRPLGTGANDACAGNDSRLSNARPASDVHEWAKASNKPTYSYSEILEAPAILSGTSTPDASLGKNGDIYIKLV